MALSSRMHIGTAAILFAFLVAVTGCGSTKDSSNSETKMEPDPASYKAAAVLGKLPGGEEYSQGKKVYADNECARCHKLGETGGGASQTSGPNLSKVGIVQGYTKKWLADHIRDPKTHKAESRMPSFPAERISDSDLNALVDYLASRK
jgi:mono/diheme cytochrome c family protein